MKLTFAALLGVIAADQIGVVNDISFNREGLE